MKLPVTETGVTLPRAWFGDATEVEVRRQNGHLDIAVVQHSASESKVEAYSSQDPIWGLGQRTSDLSISDASEILDKYLYGESE
jgi:hypothetical protein